MRDDSGFKGHDWFSIFDGIEYLRGDPEEFLGE
jgi:hypothetical protein